MGLVYTVAVPGNSVIRSATIFVATVSVNTVLLSNTWATVVNEVPVWVLGKIICRVLGRVVMAAKIRASVAVARTVVSSRTTSWVACSNNWIEVSVRETITGIVTDRTLTFVSVLNERVEMKVVASLWVVLKTVAMAKLVKTVSVLVNTRNFTRFSVENVVICRLVT